MYYRNRYNDRAMDMVQSIYRDIKDFAEEYKVAKIDFSLHSEEIFDGGVPEARFSNYNDETSYQEVGEIIINDDSIAIVSKDCRFTAFVDEYYGDYFDVAESLPKIYAAICDILNGNDLKPIELC